MKRTYRSGGALLLLALFVVVAIAGGLNSITTPDTVGDVGRYTSIALDANGFPVITYLDNSNFDLKIIHCNDPNCAGDDESIMALDTAGNTGAYPALRLDSSGYPAVSYQEFDPNFDLKVLRCNDPDCVGDDESIAAPDTVGDVGQYSSLALDADNYPVVSYYDATSSDLKLLHCNDPNCLGDDESITTPDSDSFVGSHTALVLDGDGFPVVSYSDAGSDTLNILHCNDPDCAGDDESITTPVSTSSFGPMYTSIALDAAGNPVVSFLQTATYDLNILHCNDPNCAGGDESLTVPDSDGSVGHYTSLVLDDNGFPVVTYYDGSESTLKVMHCNDPNCAGGDESIATPDTSAPPVGHWTSLALDGSGFPVVSYYDPATADRDLKLLHCGNLNCAEIEYYLYLPVIMTTPAP